jgi:hypothetical protein
MTNACVAFCREINRILFWVTLDTPFQLSIETRLEHVNIKSPLLTLLFHTQNILFFSLFLFVSEMAEELQAPERFGLCNDEKCSSFFRYLDVSVHTFVDGPDPRDHLANERNLLTWIRTGTTLSLIGMMLVLGITMMFNFFFNLIRLYYTS